VLEIDTENGLALNNLASLLSETDAKAALAYAERAYTLFPEDPNVMDTLAGALLSSGHTERAARMNERALASQPDNPAFLQRRAQILEAKGRTD
jgi:tetratricopeptide (TPR) repeat protein